MRPLNLTMSAFGPYADKVYIDFEKLGKNGLYLITGDTGAGKTTIFDGIAYALFGEPSGGVRDTNMFRSKYADIDTPTFVEFEFEYKDKIYKIKRIPTYERRRKHGEGFTTQTAEAELYFDDGRNPITKSANVNSAVIDIIGIDRSQFSQIAMIAQGDFLKVLLASTKERSEIFRKIFKTGNYQQLQFKLKDKSNKLEYQYKEVAQAINQYIMGTNCGSEDEHFEELNNIKNGNSYYNTDEILEVINSIVTNDKNLLINLENETGIVNNNLGDVNKQIGKAENYIKAKKAIALETEKLEINQSKIENLKSMYLKQVHLEPQRDEINAKIKIKTEKLKDYDELTNTIEDKNKKEAEVGELQSSSQKAEKRINALTEEVKKGDIALETLKDSPLNLTKCQSRQSDVSNKITLLNQIAGVIKDHKNEVKELVKFQDGYSLAKEDYKEAEMRYEHLNDMYLDGQAGILASDLKDGEPCPVCGSKLHPMIAKLKDEVPTQKQLNDAKKDRERKEQLRTAASEKVRVSQSKIEELVNRIKDFIKSYENELKCAKIDSEFNILFNEVKSEYLEYKDELTSLKSQETDLTKQIEEKNEIEAVLPDKKERLEKTISELNDLNVRLASEKSNLENLVLKVNEIREKLEFESVEAAKKEIEDLNVKLIDMKTAFETSKNNFEECNNAIEKSISSIEALNNQIEDENDSDLTALINTKNEILEKLNSISKEKSNITARVEKNKYASEQIELCKKKSAEIEGKVKIVKSLADTSNGTLSAKSKISLETYIQMAYFDKIIVKANTRFKDMTNGQYELKRKMEADNKQSQSGLELNVMDYYNGTERSVKTLSGGESFKASLALALGLSDEIQSRASGIQIDTLFVDEGFGSLDEESLESAMKALNSITDVGRLVGIISHVAELKTKIDKQIIVTKTKDNGSKVGIVV